jgi:hypothetical protein
MLHEDSEVAFQESRFDEPERLGAEATPIPAGLGDHGSDVLQHGVLEGANSALWPAV